MVAIALDRARVRRFAADAALKGHPGHFRLEGNCTDPAVIFLRGLPSRLMDRDEVDGEPLYPSNVVGHAYVRCRRCPPCMHYRAIKWVARGSHEMRQSNRTWFVTLTYRPGERLRVEATARKAYRSSAQEDLALATPQRRFTELVKAANPDVTNMIKRLRHHGAFRYLLVAEAHKDGFVHWHMLLHEIGQPISHSIIEREWRSGFSKIKLTDGTPKQAWYVCKYLTKSAVARLRSSARYGRDRNLSPLSEGSCLKTSPISTLGNSHQSLSEPAERTGPRGDSTSCYPLVLTSDME